MIVYLILILNILKIGVLTYSKGGGGSIPLQYQSSSKTGFSQTDVYVQLNLCTTTNLGTQK